VGIGVEDCGVVGWLLCEVTSKGSIEELL
jgi:hypothetical protein